MYQAPSFIGEFGAEGQGAYPDMLHDAIWGALTSGAAITPMKWHDTDWWSHMTDVNFDQMATFSAFVSDIPFHTRLVATDTNEVKAVIRLSLRDASAIQTVIARVNKMPSTLMMRYMMSIGPSQLYPSVLTL